MLITSISGIRGTIGGAPGEGLTPPDVVKFAKGEWGQQAMEEAFQITRTFVQETAEHPEGGDS